MDEFRERLEKVMQSHDWWYMMSDDHSVYTRGSEAKKKMRAMRDENPEIYDELYKQYAPWEKARTFAAKILYSLGIEDPIEGKIPTDTLETYLKSNYSNLKSVEVFDGVIYARREDTPIHLEIRLARDEDFDAFCGRLIREIQAYTYS